MQKEVSHFIFSPSQYTHVRGVRVFTPSDSDCPVSIVAPLNLVASATLALKAVVSSEKFGASVFGISRSTQHTHVRGVRAFTPLDSDCPVSIVAPLHLVASATLALKAVASSEEFGALVFDISRLTAVSSPQVGALRLPCLHARTFHFVARPHWQVPTIVNCPGTSCAG